MHGHSSSSELSAHQNLAAHREDFFIADGSCSVPTPTSSKTSGGEGAVAVGYGTDGMEFLVNDMGCGFFLLPCGKSGFGWCGVPAGLPSYPVASGAVAGGAVVTRQSTVAFATNAAAALFVAMRLRRLVVAGWTHPSTRNHSGKPKITNLSEPCGGCCGRF